MGKKRILITMTSMYIGGAERALLGLLNAIDTTKNDIDLLIYSHEGEFMPLIPNTVNLLPYDSRFDVFANPIKEPAFTISSMGFMTSTSVSKYKPPYL